jgi:hypothetical protein
LWARLHGLGVRGKMLFAIKSLYDCGTQLHIRTALGVLGPVPATVGVKQGCPLSPTLFALYIDSLYEFVTARCRTIGPVVGHPSNSRRVPMLLHCDDTVLMADFNFELQLLLDTVDQWCVLHGMKISVRKSEVVVFNNRTPPRVSRCRLRGAVLPLSLFFLYLGVKFDCSKGITAHNSQAAVKGRAATAAMLRRLHELDIGGTMRSSLFLYSAGPLQAMLYGCEAWGMHFLAPGDPAMSGLEAEQVHRNFVRHTLGMRSKTKAWIAFREAGTYPLQHACLSRMLKFLQNVLALPASDVCRQAMQECIWHAQCSDTDLRGSWVRRVVALLTHVCPSDTPLTELVNMSHLDLDVDVDACMSAWRAHHHAAAWGGLATNPRSAPSAGVTMCTYHQWFATDLPVDGGHWDMAPQLSTPRLPWRHVQSLTRLRTGSHDLAVQRGRRPATGGQRVPRAQRTCLCCPPATADGSRPMQDELHCVLECSSLDVVRHTYPRLFANHDNAIASLHNRLTLRDMFTDRTLVRPLASFVHNHVLPMGNASVQAPAVAPAPP